MLDEGQEVFELWKVQLHVGPGDSVYKMRLPLAHFFFVHKGQHKCHLQLVGLVYVFIDVQVNIALLNEFFHPPSIAIEGRRFRDPDFFGRRKLLFGFVDNSRVDFLSGSFVGRHVGFVRVLGSLFRLFGVSVLS